MRKNGILFSFLIPFAGMSQQSFQDSLALERAKLQRNNMYVLGSWAGANIIQGTISAGNGVGSDHYFHQMNAYWNIANCGLAIWGLLQSNRLTKGEHTLQRNTREQHTTEKILLLNSGLDAGYIMTGFYLKERGQRLNSDLSTGYGNSLVLQGSFLLVFDLIQYFENRRIGKALEKNMAGWQMAPTENGVGLSYRF